MKSFVGGLSGGENEPWIGGRDTNSNNNIYWVGSGDLLPDSSTYWGSNEPTTNRHCVYMRKSNQKIYTWNCVDADMYVCERYLIDKILFYSTHVLHGR